MNDVQTDPVSSSGPAGGPLRGLVVGVLGASGGLGASAFAAVLASVAGTLAGDAVLVDLDPASGGVDVLLGIETRPGARWSGLQLAGGALDPRSLADGLPRAGPCAVLAADRFDADADAVQQVVTAAAELGPVVLDLPRHPSDVRTAAEAMCDLVVLVVRPDVTGLVAARAANEALVEPAIGLVVRRVGSTPRAGAFAGHEVADLVGAGVLGWLPALRRPRPVAVPGRAPRVHRRLAAGILSGAVRDDGTGSHVAPDDVARDGHPLDDRAADSVPA